MVKKLGRPKSTEQRVVVCGYPTKEISSRISKFAYRNKITRSKAINILIEKGLDTMEKEGAKND